MNPSESAVSVAEENREILDVVRETDFDLKNKMIPDYPRPIHSSKTTFPLLSKMYFLTFISWAFLFQLALSHATPKNQVCFAAVSQALRKINFEGSGPSYWQSRCQNRLNVISTYASAKLYCSPAEIEAGSEDLAGDCKEYGKTTLIPMSEVAANLTDEHIKSLRIVGPNEIGPKENLTSPVLVSRKFFDLGFQTIDTWDYETELHHNYGFAMYGFWGIILGFGMLYRLFTLIVDSQRSRFGTDIEGDGSMKRTLLSGHVGPISSVYHWTQKTLVIPGAFGSYHQRLLYWCTVPTRMEGLIIYSYWLISFVLCAVNYRLFEGNLYWEKTAPQLSRYVADRTGIIAYANLALIWVFGIRNNIFLWATGWSFRTFNIFHRHVARVAVAQSIAHGVGYTVFYCIEDNGAAYRASFKESWFYMGVVAVIVMSFLVILASIFLRQKSYETFLLIHIALSVVTIVALFYHTSIFEGEYNPYLWPLVAIWGFDRTLRLIRLAYCNIRVRLAPRNLRRTQTVAIYDKGSDVIRLEVTPASDGLRLKPGYYYYLYQPFRWTGYENHPFTLGAWHTASDGDISQPMTPLTLSESSDGTPEGSHSGFGSDLKEVKTRVKESKTVAAGTTQCIFWIRPVDGWTRNLRDQCLKSENGTISASLLLEGPYGESAPLWAYESLLLIVGGTGIASAVPYVQDHIRRCAARQTTSSTKYNTHTREISLVWVARQPEFIHQVAEKELRPALSRQDFQASFYSTSTKHTAVPPIDTEKIMAADSFQTYRTKNLNVSNGRPDIKSIILGRASESSAAHCKLAILVCGPPGMADEARNAVHIAMRQGYHNIHYVEEAFGW